MKAHFSGGKHLCLLVLFVLICTPSMALARQEGLELPPWLDVGLRFSSPPYIGTRTAIIGEVILLHGGQIDGEAQFVLPSGMKLVSGELKRKILLTGGQRQRLSLTVKIERPIGRASVSLSITGSYPVKEMVALVQAQETDDLIKRRRLTLVRSLKGDRTVSRSKMVFASSDELSIDEDSLIWPSMIVIDSVKGRFFSPHIRTGLSSEELTNRIKKFEHFERLLNNRESKDEFMAKIRDKRTRKIFDYLEDLYGLSCYYYENHSSGSSKSIKELLDKALKYREFDIARMIAIRNVMGLSLVKSHQLKSAARLWASLGENTVSGTTRAYMLYNAGEVLRLGGESSKAVEFYKAALSHRPGLMIARDRIRDL